jgi:isopentenyl diphosphate isomerase/L-lactate dehydrogenase-like FMN-dependent dehydrogenase
MPIDAVNVRQLEQPARELMSEPIWNYVAGGAGDEHSLAWNEQAWQAIRLAPRVLVDVSALDTATVLLGHQLAHPIVVAPTAAQRNYHRDGERATRLGVDTTGGLAVMSTLGSTPLLEVGAAADGPWWFQLYVQSDRAYTESLVHSAVAAGASALVLTVDTPLLGARDRDRRLGGHTVDGLAPAILVDAPPSYEPPVDPGPVERVYNRHLDPALTWDTLDWLVDVSPVPVLAKGVLRSDDARRCLDHGVAGVVVSNHGARNLDTAQATAEALPGVVRAVDGQAAVLVDGGVRRGTDIAKALCLGADAVLLGRPAVWGLALDGAQGVQWVLETLWSELAMAMGLLGAPTLGDLTPDLLWGR